MTRTKSSAQSTGTVAGQHDGFTADERDAMKERAKEVNAGHRSRRVAKADTENEVLAKIAEMPEADRVLAERIHAIVRAAAPDLMPKLWYGMPAYARDGKIICHFQSAQKFKSRYATLGFSDQAALDDGTVWPSAYAVKELTAADEKRISALVTKALS
ncbi:iron chaperone [Streptacidiphilus sp. PAMC 29251]